MQEKRGDVEFSIVIPCLNEEKTIGIVVKKAQSAIKRLQFKGEVVVADNGSVDRSIFIATELGALVVNVDRRGYGNALSSGFSFAKGKFIIMGDADDSYNFDEIDDFVKFIRDGYDVVIGSRIKGKIEKGAMPFLHRYLGTPLLTYFVNLLFGTKISDCNCGLRAITKDSFLKMKLKSSGMEFASEMIIKAGILKLKMKEIPIFFYKDKRDRAPHLNTWRDGWRHLKFMFLYSPTYLFLLPGFLLGILGLLILLPLLGGPIELFGKVFDYHSAIFGSLFVVLAYQIIITGIYVKAFLYNQDSDYKSDILQKFYKYFDLDRGLLIGVVLFFAGLGLSIYVLAEWVKAGYKDLQEASLVAFASTLITIGLQTIFASFFLSILEPKEH